MRALFAYPTGNCNWSRAQTDTAIARCVSAGLDTLIWQCAVGQAEYHSVVLPESSIVAADYDPMAYAIEQAHANGLAFYAWWGVGLAPGWSAWRAMYPDADWQLGYVVGYTYRWMNFSNVDVRNHAVAVCQEIATNYDVDAILLDIIRYPHTTGFDPADYPALSPNDITSTVHAVGDAIHAIGSTPLVASVFAGWGAQTNVYQNWDTDWMTDGVCDHYLPMAYISQDAAGFNGLDHAIDTWDASVSPSLIWPTSILEQSGYPIKTPSELDTEIDYLRAAGYAGTHIAFFDSNHLTAEVASYLNDLFEGFIPTTAEFGDINSELRIGPLQSVRRNAPNTGWEAFTPGAGGGGVMSVGLSMPDEFDVTGSPVMSVGTLAAAWVVQPANTVLAGPATGADAAPAFRALVVADLPMHDMVSAHTYTGGAALDVFGLSDTDTIARLTPSSSPGEAAAILRTTEAGGLTLQALTVAASFGASGAYGFGGVEPSAPDTGWAVTAGYAADRAFNPLDTTEDEIAAVLGTLINALKAKGIIGA